MRWQSFFEAIDSGLPHAGTRAVPIGVAPTGAARMSALALAALTLGLGVIGCVEDGKTPENCPSPGEVDAEWRSTPEFEAWRKASEEAGCLTPLGGTQPGGASNGGAGDGDNGN
jgi:hypothetical protein